MTKWQKQTGLSMVELMVALLLSSLVMLGVLTLYLDSTRTSRVSESLARVQESGRIALDLIARDVRSAGFTGCADPMQKLKPEFVGANASYKHDFYGTGLRGARVDGTDWNDFKTAAGGSAPELSAESGTDVLLVRRAVGPMAVLESDMSSKTDIIDTDSDQTVTNFRIGEHALITNCIIADVFEIGDNASIDDDQITHTGAGLSDIYPEDSRVLHFSGNSYWVGDTGRQGAQGGDVYALMRNGDEMVVGVERLQVLYGVRTGDDGEGDLTYIPADDLDPADWNNVDAIRVGVLVSDDQAVMDTSDTKQYDLPGLTVSPANTGGAAATYPDDRRLRSAFNLTIKIRNLIEQG